MFIHVVHWDSRTIVNQLNPASRFGRSLLESESRCDRLWQTLILTNLTTRLLLAKGRWRRGRGLMNDISVARPRMLHWRKHGISFTARSQVHCRSKKWASLQPWMASAIPWARDPGLCMSLQHIYAYVDAHDSHDAHVDAQWLSYTSPHHDASWTITDLHQPTAWWQMGTTSRAL